jgi:hypothetical protein
MTEIAIPDSLPPLIRGIGQSPAVGGCLMQVTNYLARGIWSDSPARNVDPTLQRAAILTNDAVCDRHRKELWRFVPRLMSTFGLMWERDPRFEHMIATSYMDEREGICESCRSITRFQPFACACCRRCERMISMLDQAITLFDQISRRELTSVSSIDWSRLTDIRFNSSMRVFAPGICGCGSCFPSIMVSGPSQADVKKMLISLETMKAGLAALASASQEAVHWVNADMVKINTELDKMAPYVVVGIKPPDLQPVTVDDIEMLVEAL